MDGMKDEGGGEARRIEATGALGRTKRWALGERRKAGRERGGGNAGWSGGAILNYLVSLTLCPRLLFRFVFVFLAMVKASNDEE
jgi:hypothetical protein